MMSDNIKANMHLLSSTDVLFFKNYLDAIKNRINQIMEEQDLNGKWTISEDLQWLVKIEE